MNVLEYNDYMLEQILESIKNDETILVLSDKMKSYLSSMKHPIAERILDDCGTSSKDNFKVTFIDIVDGKKDKNNIPILDTVSFVQSNKAIEAIAKNKGVIIKQGEELNNDSNYIIKDVLLYNNKEYFNTKAKSETSFGKLLNKLYPNELKASGDEGNDIESFVNEYKSLRNPDKEFELVTGNDINYWYDEEHYADPQQGALWSSCMRHDYTNSYMNFYSVNPDSISLLILKSADDDSKIIGRSIVWKIDVLDDETLEEPKYFMDRIYLNNMLLNMVGYIKKIRIWTKMKIS